MLASQSTSGSRALSLAPIFFRLHAVDDNHRLALQYFILKPYPGGFALSPFVAALPSLTPLHPPRWHQQAQKIRNICLSRPPSPGAEPADAVLSGVSAGAASGRPRPSSDKPKGRAGQGRAPHPHPGE
jgi:hypothetical protein